MDDAVAVDGAGAGLTIRRAEPGDDRQLAELDARAWPVEVVVAPPAPADEPFFSARRSPDDVIVALDGDAVVGYVRLGPHVPLPINDHVQHVNALVVSAQARGRGVGGRLLAAAIEEAGRRRVRKLGLRVLSNNAAAIRLYERHGFTEEGRLREEFRRSDGSYADDIWMARWLAPTGHDHSDD